MGRPAATAPTTKLYLVVSYAVSFEKESHLLIGSTLLNKETRFVAAHLSSSETNIRIPPMTLAERWGDEDPPTNQLFLMSIVAHDPMAVLPNPSSTRHSLQIV